ncbi:hypothetical protein RRG08_011413 [Elysia crispata]|uniref:Uncharacterized protein n=1 Tax=Elysia crispata TaxID=231223 RepID=A0AAE1AXE9_9GAST|nr:hypothetical protein RRG08_011413 [Elysia crispata]
MDEGNPPDKVTNLRHYPHPCAACSHDSFRQFVDDGRVPECSEQALHAWCLEEASPSVATAIGVLDTLFCSICYFVSVRCDQYTLPLWLRKL